MNQRVLFLDQMVNMTLERIKNHCPPEGFYLCNSFGKDSCVIDFLSIMAEVPFDAHFHRTTVDPPQLVSFGKEHFPNVTLEKPPMAMVDLILEKHCPPLRNMRYCCRVFKEERGQGRVVMTGVRWAESKARMKKRKMVDQCPSMAKIIFNPIIDWTTEQIWDFIREYNVPVSPLYKDGFTRLGCVLCPIASYNKRLKEAHYWPKITRTFLLCFDRLVKQEGKTWETAEEVMRWWLEENRWSKQQQKKFTELMSRIKLRPGRGNDK